MYSAIFAATETLRSFLQDQLEAVPELMLVLGATILVTPANPQEVSVAGLEGLSVWLYRVVRDEEQLNAPPAPIGSIALRHPPLPVRLHFLITPIFNSPALRGPEREQRVLGRVLQVLHDHPRFVGSVLRGDLAGTTVELLVRLEPMSLEEIARVWDALDAAYQLSISYEVTVVAIQSERLETMTPVQTVIPEVGVIVGAVGAR